MITFNGHHTKLIDFSLSDSDNHCVLKMPAGTTNYIAPEVTKEGYRPNMKADIYSFGVVLKQMARTCRNTHLAHCARLCMQSDPEKRPSSACEALASKPDALRPLLLPLALTLCFLLLAALVVLPYGQHSIGLFALVAIVACLLLVHIGGWYSARLAYCTAHHTPPAQATHALSPHKVRCCRGRLVGLLFSQDF